MKKIKDPVGLLAKTLILAFALYFFWGVCISRLGIDREMNHTIHAALYEGEERLEDVTIIVDGTYRNYFFQNDIFEGTFAVSCLPKTQQKYVTASISWHEEKYLTVTWFNFHRRPPDGAFTPFIDTGASMTGHLSRDMKELFWEIDGDSFIATEKAYQAWPEQQE